MNNIYLNELSLEGQFEDVDEFLDASMPVMKCLKFISGQNEQVQKNSMFYEQRITKDKTWNDLRGMHGDKVRRLKSLLLSTTDNPPYWDMQPQLAQDLEAVYICNQQDVSATSVAEAAEANGILLSFFHKNYDNKNLTIEKNQKMNLHVPSAVSLDYLTEFLWKKGSVGFQEYLLVKFEGTRLNFSKLEKEFGFESFEKDEIRDCVQAFERFVRLSDWNEILSDRSLCYKKYLPASKKDNWFRGEEYEGMDIDKFRCTNPKRCFGYREDDVFYVLRMERDHKISDHG